MADDLEKLLTDPDYDPGATEGSARRRHRRVDVDRDGIAAQVRPPGNLSVRLVNLSVSGAGFVAPCLLGEDTRHLTIVVPRGVVSGGVVSGGVVPGDLDYPGHEGAGPLLLPCEVRHVIGQREPASSSDPQWLHGVRFADLEPAARRFLHTYVGERAVRAGSG